MAIVQTFHTGVSLNLWEECCLRSFVDHGHEVVLFSYDQLDLPPGARLLAADEIVPESERAAFFAMAPGQFGQFSDLFRYELLHARGGWWVDTDMLCPAPDLSEEEIVIGRKLSIKRRNRYRINGAVMRFPAGHALLEEATTFMRANADLIGSSWRSVAGPDLLTRLVPQYGIEAQETSLFYPNRGRCQLEFLRPREARRSCRGGFGLAQGPSLARALPGRRAAARSIAARWKLFGGSLREARRRRRSLS
jgi:hypothetical protein